MEMIFIFGVVFGVIGMVGSGVCIVHFEDKSERGLCAVMFIAMVLLFLNGTMGIRNIPKREVNYKVVFKEELKGYEGKLTEEEMIKIVKGEE